MVILRTDMDRIDQYIESLVAEYKRVDGEIARLEGIVRAAGLKQPSRRTKISSRKAAPVVDEGAIAAVPSSHQSSDCF
jgi:hypothetical protein